MNVYHVAPLSGKIAELIDTNGNVIIIIRIINIMLCNGIDIAEMKCDSRTALCRIAWNFYSLFFYANKLPAENDRRGYNYFIIFHGNFREINIAILKKIHRWLLQWNLWSTRSRPRDWPRLTVRIELSDDGLDDRSSGRHVTSSNRHLRKRIFRYLDSRETSALDRETLGRNGPYL